MENAGPSKIQRWKMQEWKIQNQNAASLYTCTLPAYIFLVLFLPPVHFVPSSSSPAFSAFPDNAAAIQRRSVFQNREAAD